jgi:hypothetical protein
MKVKNYTSQVSAERSIMMIEHCLVSAGATHIGKSYDVKRETTSAIIFQIEVRDGMRLNFKLPARVDKVFAKLWKEVRRPRKETEQKVREQAERAAWKLVYDQVAVQTANILIEQQDAAEAFFPYLYDGKRDKTLYELAKDSGFKQITMGAQS